MVNQDLKKISKNPHLLTVGLQHLLACFGATILVPLLVGFPVSIALFGSGVGTLLFHFITKGKVPAYLGSSFAFIAPLSVVLADHGGIPSALGGVIFAGLIYMFFSYLFKLISTETLFKLFPPIVIGPVIAIIGLGLAPVAVDQIGSSFNEVLVAAVTLIVAIATVIKGKGLLKIIPVITGILAGYVLSGLLGMVDAAAITDAAWFGLPAFTRPALNLSAIVIIAPVAIVTIMEHIGDVLAISEEKHGSRQLVEDPGFERTMLGDGVATAVAGLFGGVPNTTYGESVGVMALTKIYKSIVMRIAAVFAILISFLPKFEAVIYTIPEPVIGGISVLLFGMITAIGLKTMANNDVDFNKSRNLIIVSVVLILGLGGAVINIGAVEISSMVIAAVAGIVLNLILPE